MLRKYEDQTTEIQTLRQIYEQKLLQLINERDDYGRELENKDQEILTLKRENDEKIELLTKEHDLKLQKLKGELEEAINQRNFEMDRNLKIEETIDEKNEKIQ